MKKGIFFAAVLSATIFFAGCWNDVFYSVRRDVPPEDATVSGNITSITRYTVSKEEYLVLSADSGVRYKKADESGHGNWKTLVTDSLPFKFHSYDYFAETHNGEQLIKILADSTTLYLVTAAFSNDDAEGISKPSAIKLYGAEISDWDEIGPNDWTTIIGESESSKYFPTSQRQDDYYYRTEFGIFQTNAPQQNHRKAYIRTGSSDVTYYELCGTAEPKKTTVVPQEVKVDSSVANCAKSAVWFGGKVVFFNTSASTTNETYNTPATHFYYAVSETVYHSTEFGKKEKSLTAGNVVSALMTCNDALIIGQGNFDAYSSTSSSGGIRKTSLKDGEPGSKTVDFKTNASDQIDNAYCVMALLNATPDKKEEESDLYAAITYMGTGNSSSSSGGSAKNIGLWSYYPDRGNWNRE